MQNVPWITLPSFKAIKKYCWFTNLKLKKELKINVYLKNKLLQNAKSSKTLLSLISISNAYLEMFPIFFIVIHLTN